MKLFGLLMIVNAMVYAIYHLTNNLPSKELVVVTCLVCVLIGLAFCFDERVSEITIAKVGTIKLAAERALADAQAISEIKKSVEKHDAEIAAAAEDFKTLTAQLERAKIATKELEEQSEFSRTILLAQCDNRIAYDKLMKLGTSNGFRFEQEALQAFETIKRAHSAPYFASDFGMPWAEGVDPSKLDLPTLVNEYKNSKGTLKLGFLEYIWKRQDFELKSRLEFLVDVYKNDESLAAVEYAGRYLAIGLNVTAGPLDYGAILDGWEKAK